MGKDEANMIRVAIADDHHLFSDGLADALNAVPDLTVVGVAGDAAQAADLIRQRDVDVLLLDWEMPEGGGAAVLGLPRCPRAIVVTMHADDATHRSALERGAHGMVSKSAPLKDLASAVRAVAGGATLPVEEGERTALLEQHRTPRLDPGAELLTQREIELLQLLATGVSSTEDLADRLYISQKTVKNHLASIFQKLSVADRTQAAIEAIRLGLTHRG